MTDRFDVRRRPGNVAQGILFAGERQLFCALGRSGPSAFKKEGDGATPVSVLTPLYGFWRADRGARPASRLPFFPLRADAGWCDAPWNANYNRLVRLPFGPSHEIMWREDHLYDIVVVLDWNLAPQPRKQGAGSAIFMHLARPGYTPTEGCIALSRGDMEWLLRRASAQTRIVVGG